jgi:hypothetical protein
MPTHHRSPVLLAALAISCAVAACGGAHGTTTQHTATQATATIRPRSLQAALPPSCARKAPSRIPAETWSAARRQLAPTGAIAIRLCRYAGLDGHPPLALTRSALVTASPLVSELVREFDELPIQHGAIGCPFDDDSQIVALLGYPGAHTVTISVHLLGCNYVTNGSVIRLAIGQGSPPAVSRHLVSQLERLTATR